MIEHGGWVYIMSSHSRCLYIGVTSDLHGRVWEHKNGVYAGFSKKYKTHYLVYQAFFDDIETAIAREKQLKGWTRAKKIGLIERMNRPRFPTQVLRLRLGPPKRVNVRPARLRSG
jgi:putative endonuclease